MIKKSRRQNKNTNILPKGKKKEKEENALSKKIKWLRIFQLPYLIAQEQKDSYPDKNLKEVDKIQPTKAEQGRNKKSEQM